MHPRIALSVRRLPSQASKRCNFSSSPVRLHSNSNNNPLSQTAAERRSISLPKNATYSAGSARNVQSAAVVAPTASAETRALRRPDNLFHHYSSSPSSIIRKRAAFIKQNACCPHPSHQQTRVTTSEKNEPTGNLPPAHSNFECPDCGVPLYCSEEHWMDDYEAHLEVCETIRQINEDDHDLVSGRFFPEFSYPGPQDDNFVVNMTNWDTFLYTREFEAIDNERSMRQVTRMLTYPTTIASVIHELSPYTVRSGGRLTPEGLKSLTALRYTLHPPKQGEGKDIRGLRLKAPPVRIFILGARAESSLPREVWLQLTHMFPNALINLIFIGPESMANRDDEFPLPERTPENPFGGIVEDRLGPQMKITTYVDYFHTMHDAQYFYPYDPYFDCFMLFHPGLGHPASSHEWEATLPKLLETKVPIICTGYTEGDMARDIKWVREKCAGEFDVLLEPGENRFRSLRWDLNDLDPSDVSAGNWGIWAFRGKRYEATQKDTITGPLDLKISDLPTPSPTASQYLIQIHSAGTNFFDLLQIQGKYQHQPPFPWISGMEFAGTVLATPTSSSSSSSTSYKYKVGDRVFGATQGAYATHILATEEALFPVPRKWSFEDAAGLFVTAPTSYGGLVTRANVQPGEWVLVHAAAGGVGLAAVQIAKAKGATVIATAGSERKMQVAREFGADYVINYRGGSKNSDAKNGDKGDGGDWTEQVKQLCKTHRTGNGKAGVDIVYDPVGLIEQSLKCVAWNARLLVIGFAAGKIEKVALNRVLLKNVSIVGLHWGQYANFERETVDTVWRGIFELIEQGKFRGTAFADERFVGLESVARALRALGSRDTWGKVVVRIEEKSRL
ncbi:hypothetical protein UA08_06229 [Talaromyces atroroseus]|uniref:Enoyl reductase (ER) domain-containing protein n=1 Tax=Talaromyces atroroseus TaxID=1441469 RepID=A0A225AS10_TALAT|nr:hypothetical protein UA08_06229 [Talaromyces atroroseus]OKL58369.1 hypothetical protein UA08_06229 [Talaromyces atroroseus]